VSRPISLASSVEKARLDSGVPYLILADIEVRDENTLLQEVIRIVKNDEQFVHQGLTYLPTIFDLTYTEEVGRLASADISINDFTRAIRQVEARYGGAPSGFKVRVKVVNSATPDAEPEFSLYYDVKSSSATEYRVSWSLGADNILSYAFPIHKQYRDRCRFRYRGEDCSYVGNIETCDYTLDGPNGCRQHGNTHRYGGFPGLR